MSTTPAIGSPIPKARDLPRGTPSPGPAWLDERRVEEVVVVSPHLDDGVFSAHALLAVASLRRTLVTVFSDAAPGPASAWGRITGFDTTEAEFAARRIEDRHVAQALGIACVQLDVHVDDWSAAESARVGERIVAMRGHAPERTLVLLPAGAGGEVTGARRGLRRVLRQPLGSPPHGEHLHVRDGLAAPLLARGVRVGFYAELPYMWADDRAALQARLEKLTGHRCGPAFELIPDLAAKHAAAIGYRSQVVPILGAKAGYQKRVLSHPELYFLAE